MADLSELQSTQPVKIAGAGSNGLETNFVNADANGGLLTTDIANTTGLYGSIALTTTPAALRVGGSNLAERKLVTFDNSTSQVVYWGYDNTVSSTNYAGRIVKDQQAFWSIGANITIYLVLASGSGTGRVSEAS